MASTYALSHLFNPRNRKLLYSETSLQMLVFSNLITIMWALAAGWSPGILMCSYWAQSVSVGILWFFKIRCLKDFSTKKFIVDDEPVAPNAHTKRE